MIKGKKRFKLILYPGTNFTFYYSPQWNVSPNLMRVLQYSAQLFGEIVPQQTLEFDDLNSVGIVTDVDMCRDGPFYNLTVQNRTQLTTIKVCLLFCLSLVFASAFVRVNLPHHSLYQRSNMLRFFWSTSILHVVTCITFIIKQLAMILQSWEENRWTVWYSESILSGLPIVFY